MKLKPELKTNKANKFKTLKTLKKKTIFGKTKLLGILLVLIMMTSCITLVLTDINLFDTAKAVTAESNYIQEEHEPLSDGKRVMEIPLDTLDSSNYGVLLGDIYTMVTGNGGYEITLGYYAYPSIAVNSGGESMSFKIDYSINAPCAWDWTSGSGTVYKNSVSLGTKAQNTNDRLSGTWEWIVTCVPGDVISYDMYARVTDWWLLGSLDEDLSHSYSFPIVAKSNNPPTCSLSASPSSGRPLLTVTFSMSASDSDGSIASWELNIDNAGSAEYSGTGNPPSSRPHTYNSEGTYTAKLTVWDNKGATGTDTATVTVIPNGPPTLSNPSPSNGATGK